MAALKGSIGGGIHETVVLDELIYQDDEDYGEPQIQETMMNPLQNLESLPDYEEEILNGDFR